MIHERQWVGPRVPRLMKWIVGSSLLCLAERAPPISFMKLACCPLPLKQFTLFIEEANNSAASSNNSTNWFGWFVCAALACRAAGPLGGPLVDWLSFIHWFHYWFHQPFNQFHLANHQLRYFSILFLHSFNSNKLIKFIFLSWIAEGLVVWLCLSSLLAEPLPLAAAITNKSTNSPTNPLNKSIFSSFLSISSILQRRNEWNGEKRERPGHSFGWCCCSLSFAEQWLAHQPLTHKLNQTTQPKSFLLCREALQFFFVFFFQLIRKSWKEKKTKELSERGH